MTEFVSTYSVHLDELFHYYNYLQKFVYAHKQSESCRRALCRTLTFRL